MFLGDTSSMSLEQPHSWLSHKAAILRSRLLASAETWKDNIYATWAAQPAKSCCFLANLTISLIWGARTCGLSSLSLSRWFLCLANNCVESQAKDASCCRRDCKVFILPAAISEFHRISLIVFATTNHGPAPLVVCSGWWWAQRPSRRKDWLTSHLKRIVLVWPLFISKTNLTDRNIRKNMHKSSSNMHLSHIIRKMKHQLMPG